MKKIFNGSLPVAIGSDHAGFEYKEMLIAVLKEQGIQVTDLGAYSADAVDYADFAHPVANAVEKEEAAWGILICGSANGVAITANKHQGIRAALCWQTDVAALARAHNNANIICIPARFVSKDLAKEMVTTFLQTEFEGGRHERRVEKIACN